MLLTCRNTKPAEAERRLCSLQILPPQQNINVLCIADRRFIDARNPGSDGIAARNRVWNSRSLQGGDGAVESCTNFFHGADHPFPGNGLVLDLRHDCRRTLNGLPVDSFNYNTIGRVNGSHLVHRNLPLYHFRNRLAQAGRRCRS